MEFTTQRTALLTLLIFLPRTFAIPQRQVANLPEAQNLTLDSTGWTKEAIFGLLAVFTALGCLIAGLAWPRSRTWFCNLLQCM
jgi:hypothetical protein